MAVVITTMKKWDEKQYRKPSAGVNSNLKFQINPSCTFGSWHPLAAEKLMAYAMNSADDHSVFQNGVIRIRRAEKSSCVWSILKKKNTKTGFEMRI